MKLLNILAVSLGLLAAGSLTAAVDCGDTLQTLNVAINDSIPPFAFTDANGNPTGFDVDLACLLGKVLGFAKTQFKRVSPFNFPTFVSGLNDGTFTIAMSAISMTAANLAQAAAVKYNDDNQGFLYDAAVWGPSPDSPFSDDDRRALNNPAIALATLNGPTLAALQPILVGVPVGSFELSIINAVDATGARVYPNLTAVEFNDVPSAVAALRNLGILTYFANAATVTDAVTRFGTTAKPLLARGVGTTANPVVVDAAAVGVSSLGLGIFMNATCCQLYVNILAAIAQLESTGALGALRKKWNTGTFTPLTAAQQTAITPTACANTMPNLPVRCAILDFAVAKFCVCTPTFVASQA